ncbi:MAG: Flp pilus assembly complex ATPase component TadA [Phycisphaerae bacterium]|nr:Flp pilus assembly complex ATPase component TadA [Phycisphaerae bacterium]
MLENLILGQEAAVRLPEIPGEGGFFSLAKIIVMLVFIFLWAPPAGWCARDAKRLSINQFMWGCVILSGGVLGWFFWFFVPIYAVGLLFNILLAFGVIVAYAVYRDTLVNDDERILKPSNLLAAIKGESAGASFEVVEKVRLANSAGREPKIPEDPEEQKYYQAFQDLMFDVLWRRAEELFVQPAGETMKILFRIDGVIAEYGHWDRALGQSVIQYVKTICGLDVNEHRQPQKSKLMAQQVHVDRKVTLDIETAGSRAGEKLVIRIRAEEAKFTVTDIGFSDEQIAKVQSSIDAKKGLVLISGMGHAGLTSTIYAIGRSMDAFVQNIHSVETKPLMELDNITQNIYEAGSDKSFARYLQTISRREPDILLVDPCKDAETAKMIVQLVSGKNKKVFTTLHATNTLTALGRMMKWNESPEQVADTVLAVMFQRLVRKLCPACREAYKPNPETLRKMNLSSRENVTFYRPPSQQMVDKKGNPIVCATCQGSGYVGRTAVFETMFIDDNLREAIRSGEGRAIKSAARKSGLKYWDESALEKVLAGITSVQEIIRVSKEAQMAIKKD